MHCKTRDCAQPPKKLFKPCVWFAGQFYFIQAGKTQKSRKAVILEKSYNSGYPSVGKWIIKHIPQAEGLMAIG